MPWPRYQPEDKSLGVTPQVADRLRLLLEPGEQLCFVFEAETNRTWYRLLLYVLLRGGFNVTGQILVVITDRALLLTDRGEWLRGRWIVHADLPLPSTLGPLSDRRRIVLDGKPMFVPGGTEVLARAQACLSPGLGPSP